METVTAGVPILTTRVPEAWVDYNGHMGDFAYGIVFSDAGTAYMDRMGVDEAYRTRTGATLYTLESRIGFLRECHLGDPVTVELVVLDADARRLHVFMRMRGAEGKELALCEQVLLHVGRASGTPRSEAFPDAIAAVVQADLAAHRDIPRPAWVGQRMGLARRG